MNVNGKKIYVYRKGHEMKHLGRTFVRLWKEGKVNLPTSGRHSLGVDRNGKIRVYANAQTDRRKLPHKKLGLRRNIHRKNYTQIRDSMKEKMPQIFRNQHMLQNVTMTNQDYVTKYKLRKEKVQVHPGIEHVLTSNGNNEDALHSRVIPSCASSETRWEIDF